MTAYRSLKFSTILATAAANLSPGLANAQDAADDQSGGLQQQAGAPQLEEIIVTATRRETRLQETPGAISAFSGESLEAAVPEDIGDISYLVPGFTAAKVTGFNAASFSIRGAAKADIIVYTEPQVGVMIDDFVMPSVQTQLLEPFDIERVEVLRGPQGTLFGKNTTAGAVRVVTKRPDLDDWSATVQGKYARFEDIEARFAADMPLIPGELGLRIAGLYQNTDGFHRNGADFGPVISFNPASPLNGLTGEGDGRRVGGLDIFSGRAKLLWEPSANFSAYLWYEAVRDNSETVPAVNDSPSSFLFGDVLGFGGQDPGNPLKNAGITDDQFTQNRGGRRLLDLDRGHEVDVDGIHLNLEYRTGALTVTSVTGYRDQDEALISNFTGEVGPVSLFDANRATNRETFQQELRVASDFAGPFNFVAGGFIQSENIDFCVVQALGFLDVLGLQLPFGTFNDNPQVLCNGQDSEAYAVFADFTWQVDDKLTLTGGARGTFESKDWIGRPQVFIQDLPEGPFDPNFTGDDLASALAAGDFERFSENVVTSEGDWEKATWRFTATYQWTPEFMTFFNHSRGFRSGAFNDQTGTTGLPIAPAQAAPVDPETVTSFEFGFKADLLERSLRFNLTGFFQEYDDAQRQLVATITNQFGQQFQETRFFNAATLKSSGIELESLWTPVAGLEIRIVGAWLDSSFGSFEADTDFDGDIDVDFSDRPVNRAPEWEATVDARYTHDFMQGRLSWNASFAFVDDTINLFSDLGREFDTILNSRELLNANITYRDAEDRYFVRVFGKNLLDDRYRVSGQPVANLFTFTQYGAPATGGVEVGINFGGP